MKPNEIHLNDDRLAWADGCGALGPMVNPRTIVAAGGLLLNAAVVGRALLLSVRPNYVEGARSYHFAMPLPGDAPPTVVGQISPAGEIGLVPNPKALAPLSDATGRDQAVIAREALVAVACALRDAGLPGRTPLDHITLAAVREIGAFDEPPATLGELAD